MSALENAQDQPQHVSRRRYLRERKAREDAEALLEEKSRALFEANQALRRQADALEQTVAQRTAELERARQEADAANEAKSRYLATMSHEIRTPMNGVLGMAYALAETGLDDEQRDMLEVIKDSGELLLTIINDILDLSKIESGHMELEQIHYDLFGALEAVHLLYDPAARAKGLEFRLDVDDSCQRAVLGDEIRLRQIANNLVSNAIKFTQSGAITLRARCTDAPGGGLMLRMQVQDTGIGIPPDRLDRLFKPFSQMDASTARHYGGTGLGLSIASQLTGLMGGRIWVDSTEGQGTTFHIDLPLALPAPSAAPELPDETDAEALAAWLAARDPALLVAEDNATNRLVLEHRLRKLGLSARFVENGLEALNAWEAGGLDLILMDIHMPQMDGVTATQAIRRREAETGARPIPIVAFSADAMADQVAQYLSAGMSAHLAKPGNRNDLLHVLFDMLSTG